MKRYLSLSKISINEKFFNCFYEIDRNEMTKNEIIDKYGYNNYYNCLFLKEIKYDKENIIKH